MFCSSHVSIDEKKVVYLDLTAAVHPKLAVWPDMVEASEDTGTMSGNRSYV